jgi:hypothetical protein
VTSINAAGKTAWLLLTEDSIELARRQRTRHMKVEPPYLETCFIFTSVDGKPIPGDETTQGDV